MKLRRQTRSSLGLVLAAIALTSCARTPEDQTTTQSSTTQTHKVQVSRIDLGRTIGTDSRITTTTESFAPRDTVYAAVVFAGPAPASQITARWTAPDGQVVSESTQMVTPSETEAITQFHVVKPEGLAPGSYKLEIVVDGEVASTKMFTITGS